MRIPSVSIVPAALAVCASLCGCAAPGGGGAEAPGALLARQAALAEEVKALQGECRALRASQEEIDHRYADETFAQPLREGLERLGGRVGALERRMEALEAGTKAGLAGAERKLQAVVEEVGAENARLRTAVEGLRRGVGGGEYTVRPGDTLDGIARRHGVPAEAIAEANELTDPDMVRAGRKLKIPAPAR